MARIVSVGERDVQDVFSLGIEEEVGVGKVEVLLRAGGHVTAHEFSVEVKQGVAACLKSQLPGDRPAFGRHFQTEFSAAPGECRYEFIRRRRAFEGSARPAGF